MRLCRSLIFSLALLASFSLYGHEDAPVGKAAVAGNVKPIRADSHAPIGVMGDHLHGEGEWMVSYRYMRMGMEGNLRGGSSISPEEIVSTVTNPNGPPPTVRVVPLDMTTEMHMLGLMYAPSDSVTLMAMLHYVDKTMDHQTFMGMAGTTRLGRFTTASSGVGDTRVSALVRLFEGGHHKLHANLGLSLPTGSIDETDTVLTPMNTRVELRLPYAMQLGSGTYDLEPGLTYSGGAGHLGWGAQYLALLRLGENDEDYTLGDQQRLTLWGSYRLADGVSVSLRVGYADEDAIDGRDGMIAAPVTTANPRNYGGERVDTGVGLNLVGQRGALRGHRLALEYQWTEHQHVNGVQMAMDDMLILGYQYAF